MKIRTITYARLANTGNYSNQRLEATAELDEAGEDATAVANRLADFVDSQLDAIIRTRQAYERAEAERRQAEYKAKWEAEQAERERAREAMEATDDIPFDGDAGEAGNEIDDAEENNRA